MIFGPRHGARGRPGVCCNARLRTSRVNRLAWPAGHCAATATTTMVTMIRRRPRSGASITAMRQRRRRARAHLTTSTSAMAAWRRCSRSSCAGRLSNLVSSRPAPRSERHPSEECLQDYVELTALVFKSEHQATGPPNPREGESGSRSPPVRQAGYRRHAFSPEIVLRARALPVHRADVAKLDASGASLRPLPMDRARRDAPHSHACVNLRPVDVVGLSSSTTSRNYPSDVLLSAYGSCCFRPTTSPNAPTGNEYYEMLLSSVLAWC